MATKAHCAYCFDSLAANFERRQPLSLAQVEELWEQYNAQGRQEDSANASIAPERDSASASNSSLPSTSTGSSASSGQAASDRTTPASSSSSRSSLLSLGSNQKTALTEHPLFVTWNTVSRSGDLRLRGCIGTFEPQELGYGLRSYALTSALEDVRFQPIPASLLPSLSCHVTLLTNFSQPQKDPLAWTIGKHGIRISFTQGSRRYGSTYLPDVTPEQGWTKEEALISLMRKAGWNGSSSTWQKAFREGAGELITYEGKAVHLRYPEWKAWRDWVDEAGGKAKN